MYLTMPNGSIPLDKMIQVLTLLRHNQKILPNITILLLPGPLVTI